MVEFINRGVTIPYTNIDLLNKFLIQNNGKLSQTKKVKFFNEVPPGVIVKIENEFNKYFKYWLLYDP